MRNDNLGDRMKRRQKLGTREFLIVFDFGERI